MKELWRIIPLILLWLFSSGSAFGFFGLAEKSASGEIFSEIAFFAPENSSQSQCSCSVDVPNGYDCAVESILWTYFDPLGLMSGGGGAEYMRGIQNFQADAGSSRARTAAVATVALPVALYMGPVAVAKEAASEGFERATGIPTSIKDIPSLAKKGWKGLKNLFSKKGSETPGGPSAKDVSDESKTMFRGVNAKHPHIEDAKDGVAKPKGGHTDPQSHTDGDTDSEFTSWTEDPDHANWRANRAGEGGVVLKKEFSEPDLIKPPDPIPGEAESLVQDVVKDAEVIKPTPPPDGYK